jgi:hypothetical protein
MTEPRHYESRKTIFSKFLAEGELIIKRDTEFAPQIVNAFLNILDKED